MVNIITHHPEKYQGLGPKYDVYFSEQAPATATWCKNQGLGTDFKDLENTASGPCLILGMGPSRSEMKKTNIPVFAINSAIKEYPEADYWCAFDRDALKVQPSKATKLITYGYNLQKDWSVKPEFPTIFVDIYPEPTHNKKRTLYWNNTSFGWTLHLAIIMGYDPIYILGIDMSEGGYNHHIYDEKELCAQHRVVNQRIERMFNIDKKEWYEKPVRLIDLSTGKLPIEKMNPKDAPIWA